MIKHQEPVFDQLMKNGNNLLESAEPGPEKDELEAKLADTEERWRDIKQNTAEHLARVDAALPEAEKYNESASSLGPWVAETEEKLESLEPIVASQEALDKLNKAVELLRDDINQHRPERDSVSVTSEAVIDLTEADGDIVRSEATDTVERYDKLDTALASREKELVEVRELLDQYQGLVKPVDKLLEKVDAALESQGSISVDVGKNKEDLYSIKVPVSFNSVQKIACAACGIIRAKALFPPPRRKWLLPSLLAAWLLVLASPELCRRVNTASHAACTKDFALWISKAFCSWN